jgi:hypothetical protein
MQHDDVFAVFRNFFINNKPSRVVEIGTSSGGLTYFLKDVLNELYEDSIPIKTFDRQDLGEAYNELRAFGIDVYVGDVFADEYKSLKDLKPFIQEPGLTVVLCDGGNKITEFNFLSDYLKPGDIIMAHDYVDTHENFHARFINKIWNWCEITDSDIQSACERNNLVPYCKDEFDKVVWGCRKKV